MTRAAQRPPLTDPFASGDPAARAQATSAVAAARPVSYWLDDPRRPVAGPSLAGPTSCDLLVVGGGFTGLWTALLAKQADPDRDVVLVEGDRVAWAATGRNGGFCEASLTHGDENGAQRFPEEADRVVELGRQNLDAIEAGVAQFGIHCGFARTGQLSVATSPYQVEPLRTAAAADDDLTFLDQDAVRAELNSPTYLAGLLSTRSSALVNPARLAWGLAEAARTLGVRIYENTAAVELSRTPDGVAVRTPYGRIDTARVALGTNAFPALLRRLRPYTVPVYDYVLVSEPLTATQRDQLGWTNRRGVADTGNQFHYYRLTDDGRILWGGYDAIYHFGRGLRPSYDQRPESFIVLAEHFFATFPQLEGLRFTHRWGGAIDTCTRFFAFFGTALGGRVSYALGYTGLGVGASRFGARVMLDLLGGQSTELTELAMVRRRPLPFPPEPAAYLGVQATRAALAAADRNDGRRNAWLRTLDGLGLGFDS